MPAPALQRRGDALYLVDDSGTRWRVHDARYTGGKAHRVPLGDPNANTRYFIAADGTKRAYWFGKDMRRGLTVDVVLDHFKGAGYLGEPFDPSTRNAR